MSLGEFALFTAATLVVFGVALALQLRWLGGHALRKALVAWDGALDEAGRRRAVAAAVGGVAGSGPEARAASHLLEAYPRPLRHLRLARRASVAGPVALAGLAAVWRAGLV